MEQAHLAEAGHDGDGRDGGAHQGRLIRQAPNGDADEVALQHAQRVSGEGISRQSVHEMPDIDVAVRAGVATRVAAGQADGLAVVIDEFVDQLPQQGFYGHGQAAPR